MQVARSVSLRNPALLPKHNSACINVFVYHEGGDTAHLLAVYHCPVDRGGTAILREKSSMEIERTELRHRPNLFRQHPEGHDYEQICLEISELLQELRILKFYRLEHWDIVLHGELLHRTLVHLETSATRLVGYSYHSDYIIFGIKKCLQRSHRKLRCSHVYDSCLSECAHEFALYFSPP